MMLRSTDKLTARGSAMCSDSEPSISEHEALELKTGKSVLADDEALPSPTKSKAFSRLDDSRHCGRPHLH
jgi:hypothetical protein